MRKNCYIATALAAALCIGLFAGCAGGSHDSDAVETSTSAEPTTAVTTSAAPTAGTSSAVEASTASTLESSAEDVSSGWTYTPISYPLTDTETTLDYWVIWELSPDTQYSDVNEHVVLKELADATGVRLNVKAQSQASGQTNTDLMIASGDYPDLIGNLNYSTGMDAAIEDEVVVNLKDDIPEYAPDYYKYLIEDNNKLWKAVQTDEGNIGAFVTVGTKADVSDGLMVYQFMLDDLNFKLDDLKTIDSYEKFLTAAKNKYGMAAPLYLPGDFMLDGDTIANAYGVSLKIDAITGDLPWIVKDGEVKFGYLEDGFTDYVTLMNSWYQKGLIDSDTASHPTEYKNEDLIGLVANKQVALFSRGSGLVDLLASLSGETVCPAYSPTVEEGDQLHIGGPQDSVSGESGLVITTGCDQFELAMKFCNYLYTDDFYIPSNYGVEGETYTIDDNGDPQFEEWTYTTQGRTFSSVMMDYTLFTMVDANVVTPGQSEAALSCAPVWGSNLDSTWDYPTAAAMNTSESDSYNQRAGDIVTLCQQYTAKFITGELPLSEIPEFQQKIRDTGIDTCMEAKQSAYDRYMARE